MSTLQLPPTFQADPDTGEPWLGYIRVSTWREEKISPELQRTAIEQWAARTGRRIVDWIVDLDATGRNFKRKIMRGIERVEGKEARGIAVWKYSRFGRDRTGNAINLARLENVGGRLESATEQIDASTAIGRFQRGMILEFAAFESDRAGEQWKETHDHRRGVGLPATGRRRFGYIWHQRYNAATGTLQKEWYEPDSKIEKHVEQLYKRKIGYGERPKQGFAPLAAYLNDLGYKTNRGNAWTANSVERYMDTGFAAGMLRLHAPDCQCGEIQKCYNYIYVDGAHDGIIDLEVWEMYQAHRKETKATAPRARNPIYPLTGLLRHDECRRCLAHITGGVRGREERGYGVRCNHAAQTRKSECKGVRATRARAEKEVRKWLAREVAGDIDDQPVTHIERTDIAEQRAAAARERTRLLAELDKLSAGLARLQADRAVNPDDYPQGVYEQARDRIKAQQQVAQTALDRCVETEATPYREDYAVLIVGLLDEWDTLLAAEKNNLLKQVLRRVVVIRVEREGKRPTARFEFHPVWKPDPWADVLPTE
ncbi:recombinase family protein [Streptomyces phaeochromogenes]